VYTFICIYAYLCKYMCAGQLHLRACICLCARFCARFRLCVCVLRLHVFVCECACVWVFMLEWFMKMQGRWRQGFDGRWTNFVDELCMMWHTHIITHTQAYMIKYVINTWCVHVWGFFHFHMHVSHTHVCISTFRHTYIIYIWLYIYVS